ncbi:lymphocyte antigen 75-like isoform X2 [Achroia grisella]|uniref:lymphocyte antigen 75-like isoform X2 n=1 Tax=Achroia grisella TaxID=688607 RepID=UPI0027D32D00|nr:lymphocyte antigen 75-like isoform X2 [Achroia grisella]
MKPLLVSVLFIIIASSQATPPRVSKSYRNDYTYNKKTDAFYKLHIESADQQRAVDVCREEGAALMVPDSHMDIIQFHEMYKQFPDLGDYVWVGNDKIRHESAEEEAIFVYEEETTRVPAPWNRECNVATRHGEIETYVCANRLPFVCKVDANQAPYDSACGVYANGYEYVANIGSCYKIPRLAYAWNEAYAECRSQGAHLVVLNSQAEHDAVMEVMRKTRLLPDSYMPYYFIAGYRATVPTDGSPRVFKTIFNQTITEAGYSKWADTEPNNVNGNENCGSLFENDGNLNDQDCAKRYGFICEKEKDS